MEKRCHSGMRLGQFWLSMRTSFVAVTKPPEERRIRFRIGINLGDVIVEEHDIFGDGVNVAGG
jgi:class 3 adenylate cyclase